MPDARTSPSGDRLLARAVSAPTTPRAAPGPRVLEVHQVWGEVLLGTLRVGPGEALDVGDDAGALWTIGGVPLGLVPPALASLLRHSPPLLSEVHLVSRQALSVPAEALPAGGPHVLFRAEGEGHVAVVPHGWRCEAELDGERLDADAWIAAGRGRRAGGGTEIPVIDGLTVVVYAGGIAFVARRVPPGVPDTAPRARSDRPFALITGGVLALGAAFAALVALTTPPPVVTTAALRPGGVIVNLAQEPPPAGVAPVRGEVADVGGRARARGPEGRSGVTRAPDRSSRGELGRSRTDAEIARGAGLAAVFDGRFADALAGSGLSLALSAPAGRLTGPVGSGRGTGLALVGDGLGGGGEVASLGGLAPSGAADAALDARPGFGDKSTATPVARVDEPITLGNLDARLVDEVVKRHLARFRWCYQRRLQHDPSLAGKVSVTFTIARDGSVTAARVKASSVGDGAVDRCVTEVFRGLAFPPPKGGGVAVVTYPFVFSPG